ncbi:MAG: hypothetical protein IPG00_14240 [Saprospiraceae bacterium]|nr:hypothetical protein [Saprospiraceae bacterium]
MYANRTIINTTASNHGGNGLNNNSTYWSSTEYDFYNAYMIQFFNNGNEVQNNKDSSNVNGVRLVRRFLLNISYLFDYKSLIILKRVLENRS